MTVMSGCVNYSRRFYDETLRDPAGNLIALYHAGENRLNPPWRVK